jgi:starvation-inducible DNA-binding protein
MAKANKADNSTKAMAEQLGLVLADTYVLAVKTHGYHWNVEGPHFGALHALFEAEYNDLIAAADVIAERIRALGVKAPTGMATFLETSAIKENTNKNLSAKDMIADLVKSHEKICERLSETEVLADEVEDVVSEDLMVNRLATHEKTLWMLKSHLK